MHFDENVQAAIQRLTDELCSFERVTGIESVLILRQADGFAFRAVSGKPGIPPDISDAQLLDLVK